MKKKQESRGTLLNTERLEIYIQKKRENPGNSIKDIFEIIENI